MENELKNPNVKEFRMINVILSIFLMKQNNVALVTERLAV
jgi:hypothetical protein